LPTIAVLAIRREPSVHAAGGHEWSNVLACGPGTCTSCPLGLGCYRRDGRFTRRALPCVSQLPSWASRDARTREPRQVAIRHGASGLQLTAAGRCCSARRAACSDQSYERVCGCSSPTRGSPGMLERVRSLPHMRGHLLSPPRRNSSSSAVTVSPMVRLVPRSGHPLATQGWPLVVCASLPGCALVTVAGLLASWASKPPRTSAASAATWRVACGVERTSLLRAGGHVTSRLRPYPTTMLLVESQSVRP
jgi:hypothetical protein